MAAYQDDYKNPLPTGGTITIAQLTAMNTNEMTKGTAANAAYAAGWMSVSDFSKYKGGSTGGSGEGNYQSKTFGKSVIS